MDPEHGRRALLHGSAYLVLLCKAIHAIPDGESKGAYAEELGRVIEGVTRCIQWAREEGGGDAALQTEVSVEVRWKRTCELSGLRGAWATKGHPKLFCDVVVVVDMPLLLFCSPGGVFT